MDNQRIDFGWFCVFSVLAELLKTIHKDKEKTKKNHQITVIYIGVREKVISETKFLSKIFKISSQTQKIIEQFD